MELGAEPPQRKGRKKERDVTIDDKDSGSEYPRRKSGKKEDDCQKNMDVTIDDMDLGAEPPKRDVERRTGMLPQMIWSQELNIQRETQKEEQGYYHR